MNRTIVDDAIARSGRASRKDELLARVAREVRSGSTLFSALHLAGIPADAIIAAAAAATGLPPAPRILLARPQIPEQLEAGALHDAGAVPLGSVQGRLWVAFSDPDAAKAAIFPDDVVVCLATDDDLELARDAFEQLHPKNDDAATLTIGAVGQDTLEAIRRQQRGERTAAAGWDDATAQASPLHPGALRAPTSVGAPRPRPGFVEHSEEDLFDVPATMLSTSATPLPPPETTNARLAAATTAAPQASISTALSMSSSTVMSTSASPVEAESAASSELHLPWEHAGGAQLEAVEAAPTRQQANPIDAATSESSSPERLRLLRVATLGRLRRFRFDDVLGSGAMATVYRALDKPSGRVVAVKVLEPHLMNDATAVARFEREVRALRALDHPHITATLDGAVDNDNDGDAAGVCWLCVPFLDGGTLAELLARTGPMPVPLALPIFAAVLEGVAHAHAHGVLHRDLKPQNVLLSTTGDVQVADFGLARIAGDIPVTRTGLRAGTPAYMAPEQGRGEDIDERADLFAAGVMLVELLSGRHPFARGSVEATLLATAEAGLGGFRSGVDVVDAALARLVVADRDRRFPSADAALDHLRPLLESLPAVEAVVAQAIANPAAIGAAVGAALNASRGPPRTSVDYAAAASGFDDSLVREPEVPTLPSPRPVIDPEPEHDTLSIEAPQTRDEVAAHPRASVDAAALVAPAGVGGTSDDVGIVAGRSSGFVGAVIVGVGVAVAVAVVAFFVLR